MKTFKSLRAARRRLKDSGGWLFDLGEENGWAGYLSARRKEPYAVTDCKGTAVDLRGKKRIALAEAAKIWDETKALTFKQLEAVMDHLESTSHSVVRGSPFRGAQGNCLFYGSAWMLMPRLTGRYYVVSWEQHGPRVVSSFNSLAELRQEVEWNYIDPLGWYE